MAQNDMVNDSHSSCYMINGTQFYILDNFDKKNMAELIGQLGNAIYKLPVMSMYDTTTKVTSPYDINIKNPVIDIFIDSPGGDGDLLRDISTLLNIAKHRGAIIRTTVLSRASSCGSLLAIQGTPGFRIMSHAGQHFIHFGSAGTTVRSQEDLDKIKEMLQYKKDITHATYLTHTNITKKQLDTFMKNESSYLSAEECLKLNMCDWIIGEHGQLKGRTK